MGFSSLWPGFGVGGVMKRDMSNVSAHPDSSKHEKFLRGDGTFVTAAEILETLRVDVPASDTAPGTEGTWAQDEDYRYYCVATDTWRRTPLSGW